MSQRGIARPSDDEEAVAILRYNYARSSDAFGDIRVVGRLREPVASEGSSLQEGCASGPYYDLGNYE